MTTRRAFLAQAGGLLLATTAGLALPSLLKRKRVSYFIVTPSHIVIAQNLDLIGQKTAKVISLPGVETHSAPLSLITVVNDDGTNLRRFSIPRLYHCFSGYPGSKSVFLVGNFGKSCVVELNRETLEVVNISKMPTATEAFTFAGHAAPLPGKGMMAFGMIQSERGKFDHVSIRDVRTLKEVSRVSSYGFMIHEVRLTPDQQHLICGHYGSLVGLDPYHGLGYYGKNGGFITPPIIYPPSVTIVALASGKRVTLDYDWRLQQVGHAEADDRNQIYLPKASPLFVSSPNVENETYLKEGIISEKNSDVFRGTVDAFGIALIFDAKYREMIVPMRQKFEIFATAVDGQKTVSYDYSRSLESAGIRWPKAGPVFVCGIAFHPDGRHYILSTVQGILAFERGTHRLNPQMSFELPTLQHSHVHIA